MMNKIWRRNTDVKKLPKITLLINKNLLVVEYFKQNDLSFKNMVTYETWHCIGICIGICGVSLV